MINSIRDAFNKLMANLLSAKVMFLIFSCVAFWMDKITVDYMLIIAAPIIGLRFAQGMVQAKNGGSKNGKT